MLNMSLTEEPLDISLTEEPLESAQNAVQRWIYKLPVSIDLAYA
jgi:hypothetical protein